MSQAAPVENYCVVIEPEKSLARYWQEFWAYRSLLFFLAWRDIVVRYKQTVVGVSWTLIRPLFAVSVFSVVFGKLAKFPTGGAPYPILVFAGILPWQLFSGALAQSATSLVVNADLVSKVYFPRLVIPSSAVVVNLVDFLIAFMLYIVMMLCYGYHPGPQVLLLPLFLALALFTALTFGMWLSALCVSFRDFRYLIPFILQLAIYISPVGFSSAVVPESWRFIYSLNPMVGVIDGFRWCLLPGGQQLYVPGVIASVAVVFGFWLFGVRYFRKVEHSFADII